ncbi:MAG TPA: ABC transporter ATP-binding protein [Arachnia sp.]|nr:ABC transporter ATP-binding protein [Arachnia sp.]
MPERAAGLDGRLLLPVAPGGRVARWLWAALRGRRAAVAGVFLLFLAEAAVALVFPLVLGALVDTVADGSDGVPRAFWGQAAGLASAALAAGGIAWAGGIALARIAETTIAGLREAYVAAALELPRATVEAAGTGDIVTRASDDIAQVSDTLPDVLPKLAISAFTIVLVAAGLGALDPRFLAGFVLVVPLYAVTVRWYLRAAPRVYEANRAAQSVRGQYILGTLTQLPTVVAHRLEKGSLSRIEGATWEVVRWSMRTRIVQNRLFGRLNVAEAVGLFAVLGVGVWLASTRTVTPGEATSAALLFLSTVAPISALLFVMDDLQSALAALGRLVGVIDAAASAPGGGGSVVVGERADHQNRRDVPVREGITAARQVDDVSPRPGGGSAVVVVEEVHHEYRPGVPVLEGITLSLRAGEVVAVVGATGSGKTTLASLIAGAHRPTGGRIRLGVPPRSVMTVTQETHVFAGTLRDNLTVAAPGAGDARIAEALRTVCADGLIGVLPEGLDTLVGHGGHPLTAAQAQQLALARLVLADPAVVILDEATAEADTADTGRLDMAAAAAIRGRTALVIAHRLSQAASADRIVVLDGGRIVESGTHAGLVAAGGSYAGLWSAWTMSPGE